MGVPLSIGARPPVQERDDLFRGQGGENAKMRPPGMFLHRRACTKFERLPKIPPPFPPFFRGSSLKAPPRFLCSRPLFCIRRQRSPEKSVRWKVTRNKKRGRKSIVPHLTYFRFYELFINTWVFPSQGGGPTFLGQEKSIFPGSFSPTLRCIYLLFLFALDSDREMRGGYFLDRGIASEGHCRKKRKAADSVRETFQESPRRSFFLSSSFSRSKMSPQSKCVSPSLSRRPRVEKFHN